MKDIQEFWDSEFAENALRKISSEKDIKKESLMLRKRMSEKEADATVTLLSYEIYFKELLAGYHHWLSDQVPFS